MPPWPTTRRGSKPLAASATWHIASIGFARMMKTAPGEAAAPCPTTLRTMLALVPSRSSRVMPGLRGTPEVTITTSEPAVSAQSLVPVTLTLDCIHGVASRMSSARPCGRPSTMSISTTSA